MHATLNCLLRRNLFRLLPQTTKTTVNNLFYHCPNLLHVVKHASSEHTYYYELTLIGK